MAMTQEQMQAMLEGLARAMAEQQRMANEENGASMQAFAAQFARAM